MTPDEQLDANRRTLDGLLARVVAAADHRPAYAASLAQAAAEFAWFNHTGWYTSSALEQAVVDLGRRRVRASAPRARAAGPRGPGRPAETLHVSTQHYPTGGSTQAVVSWTDELADRAHHLVLTRQATIPVPAKVRSRLGERVRLTRLDTRPGDLLHRAGRLRALAAGTDLVLLHSHPYDVVPVLAFADRTGLPPVVYVDHADHVFWLGSTATDHVLHMRGSGRRLALERRGLPAHRSLVGNRPLAFLARSVPRDAAKAGWDLGADDVLMVSAAEPTKFVPDGGPHLSTLVEPLLAAHPRLHWLVAGPQPGDEPWADLARRTGGRARAVGRLTDMSRLHQAADLFLDSFPFTSLTSLLESGALGNPVVTFRGHPESCAVFGSDSPGIDDLMFRPSTAEALRDVVTALVQDATLRRRSGEVLAEAVVNSHGGPRWVAAMESLYDLPGQLDSTGTDPVLAADEVDRMTLAVMNATTHHRDAGRTVGDHLGSMPTLSRLREWRGLREAVGPRAVLPDWSLAAVRSLR